MSDDFSDGLILGYLLNNNKKNIVSGTLRGISDSGSSILISADKEISYGYTYQTFTYSDSITITKTETDAEGKQVITTTTQNFSKTIITAVYDLDGNQILEVKHDDHANITGYYDSDGKEIVING